MSNTTPPKNRKARSDSLTPSTGAEPEPPYSPKVAGVIPPASPSQPPSNTAFPSSMASTGKLSTKKRSAEEPFDDNMVVYGPENKPQSQGSTTATSDPKLEIKAVLAAVPDSPTSGSYGSKPLEPGYATAGLNLTKPSKEQGTIRTKDFKTQTDEGVGGGVNVRVGEGKELSTAEKLELELAETKTLVEEIKRATEAFVSDKDDESVVETGRKTG